MSLLKWQMQFFITFSLSVVLYGAWGLQSHFSEIQKIEQSIKKSFEVELKINNLTPKKVSKTELDELEILTDKIEPEMRRGPLRRLIIAFRENTSLKNPLEVFSKTETEFRRYQGNQLEFHTQKLHFLASISFLLLSSSLLSLLFFFKLKVLKPLKGLSKKMQDFINDQYTYQFTVPSQNEFGQLQATFNSLAQRILSTMEQFLSLDHAKSEFLSIASHELRTPLTSIKGSLSLLQSGVAGPQNETATHLMKIAESETDRLIRLINELLDLAKIEAGKFEVQKDWQNLKELITKTFFSLEGLASTAQVRLEMNLPEDTPLLMIYADSDRIQQVLTNLLSNAIKFSPQNGSVQVEVQILENQSLCINVKDQGKGIAPEDQELIFQKFRQATNAKNPLVKGTGLGLAIAKALVEEHGGTIGVASSPGLGSTFYFTLPEWKPLQNEPNIGAAA